MTNDPGNDDPQQYTAPVPGWEPASPLLMDPLETPPEGGDPQQTQEQPAAGGDGGDSGEQTRSRVSTSDLISLKKRVETGTRVAGVLARAVGGLLNGRLARHADDETWRLDKQSEREIAEPIGRILARRVPLPDGSSTMHADLADGLEAGAAVFGYIMKSLQAAADASRLQQPQGRQQQQEQPAPAAPEPPAPATEPKDVTGLLGGHVGYPGNPGAFTPYGG